MTSGNSIDGNKEAGISLDPALLERYLAFLDRLYETRMRLHVGDAQAAVMRILTRACTIEGEPGVSLHALARQTGIPRETLRRKIGTLINKRFVEQDAEKRFRPTEAYRLASRQDMIETTREMLALSKELRPFIEKLDGKK